MKKGIIIKLTIIICAVFSFSTVAYAQDKLSFETNISVGTDMHIGTFKNLNETLDLNNINGYASNWYASMGLGFAIEYKNFSFAPHARIGFNSSNSLGFYADGNLINLGYWIALNDKVQLKPYLGFGAILFKNYIDLPTSYNALGQLKDNPNSISIKFPTSYMNLGVLLREIERDKLKISYSLQWNFGLLEEGWRRGTSGYLSDIAPTRMNALSLNILLSI